MEAALVTPILLVLFLGIAAFGLWLMMSYQLLHAATEGAIAGAGDSCGVAIATARQVYAKPLDAADCTVNGQLLEVTLTDTLFGFEPPFTVTRTARAVLR